MSWFFFAVICVLGWGLADLFYKRGTGDDRYSHLKIAVWVGLVMGVCALCLLPLSETGMSFKAIISNAVRYSPASLCYIISMVIGYAGLRYLELSIVSPVQNASGALSALVMLVYFMSVGRMGSISEELTPLQITGTLLIVAGVIALGVVEQRLSRRELASLPVSAETSVTERKYRFGALALLFPVLYCVFDTLGTAADGIILDEEVGLGLGEIDVIILYGLTFFAAGIIAWLSILVKTKEVYNPFGRGQRDKGIAAVCEEFGQVFYVYAMASKPVLAAPMVASYCIVSVILSRVFLKEKLTAGQYACVILVIIGIVMLGIADGIAEM